MMRNIGDHDAGEPGHDRMRSRAEAVRLFSIVSPELAAWQPPAY
jgi:hypothetical protein